jgi:hypothetical protein
MPGALVLEGNVKTGEQLAISWKLQAGFIK